MRISRFAAGRSILLSGRIRSDVERPRRAPAGSHRTGAEDTPPRHTTSESSWPERTGPMTLIDIEIDRNANPVDEIEQLAHANDWTFERSSEDEITVSVAGHWCEYHVSFTWMDEFESLHLAAAFDLKVTSPRHTEVVRLLAPTLPHKTNVFQESTRQDHMPCLVRVHTILSQ
jgi:hypothetical protein